MSRRYAGFARSFAPGEPASRKSRRLLRAQTVIPILLLACCLRPAALDGQIAPVGQWNPLGTARGGLRLYGVSVFSGYYSGQMSGLPFGVGVPFTGPAASSSIMGAMARVGWTHTGRKSNALIAYSPSYIGDYRHSTLSTVNHQLSAGLMGEKGKWNLSATAGGYISNREQLLFPTAVPNDFPGPGAPGSPVELESPDEGFLLGTRVLSGTAKLSASRTLSDRSSLEFSAYGTRLQYMRVAGDTEDALSGPAAGLAPRATTVGLTSGWAYSLTPRTKFTATVLASRMMSRFQTGNTTSVSLGFSRNMSRRWFVQASGGAGVVAYTRQTSTAPPRKVRYVAGAALGYKTYAHAALLSYDRSLGDRYGLGSTATTGVMGTWRWGPPRSPWSLFANFGYRWLDHSAVRNTGMWRGAAGGGRALGAGFSIGAQAGYFRLPARLSQAERDLSRIAAFLSLTWTPSAIRR